MNSKSRSLPDCLRGGHVVVTVNLGRGIRNRSLATALASTGKLHLNPSALTKPLSSATRVLLCETVSSTPTGHLQSYSSLVRHTATAKSYPIRFERLDVEQYSDKSAMHHASRMYVYVLSGFWLSPRADSLSVFAQKRLANGWVKVATAARISIHSTAWRQFRPECPSPRSSLTTPQTMPRTRAPAPRPTSMSHPVTVKGQQ